MNVDILKLKKDSAEKLFSLSFLYILTNFFVYFKTYSPFLYANYFVNYKILP